MLNMSLRRCFLSFALCTLMLVSCEEETAQRVVDAAIEKHGGRAYETFSISFDFRNRHYIARRNGGVFNYTREFTDTTGVIRDELSNNGLQRYRNDSLIALPDDRRSAFSNSVNSVVYFALLPFGLNDKAVKKEWVGETTIKGSPYQLVRVTFEQDGGGKDHEDVFLYWFHKDNHTMDYMAYSYKTDGGGLRFREAFNPRVVSGIRFQDYVNYRPEDETIPLDSLQSMFEAGKLRKLSVIDMENLRKEN